MHNSCICKITLGNWEQMRGVVGDTIMSSLVKRATAAAVRIMGRVTESSQASDSGVGTKNSSRAGSRRRRRERSRSATLSRRRLPVDPSVNAACFMAAPPRRSTVRSIAASTPAGDSGKTTG